MSITVSEIYERFHAAGLLVERFGPDRTISGFAPADDFSAGDIIFVDDEAMLPVIRQSSPAAVVTTAELARQLRDVSELPVLVADDVKLAHALVRQRYDDADLHRTEWPRLHPSAVIHPSVELPDSVTVGPNCVIGRGVHLGERVVVQANAVIEENAFIDDDAVVHARVYIGRGCRIGKRTRLKPGCVIGADGFGFVRDQASHWQRVPQTGTVVVEDDVVISANCTVDRGTYRETRIARGTKIDALCHIAHNVFLDEDCLLVAQCGIAGSSRFGKRVIASGQTGVLDHMTVVDDVVMVHRCGVTEDIREPGMYATTPPQPFRDYTRNIAVFRKLFDLRKRLKSLEEKVERLLGGGADRQP